MGGVSNSGGVSVSGWVDIVNAVKSPFGVLTLLILVMDGLLTTAALRTERISLYAPFGLLALIVIMFFVTLLIKPEVLYPPEHRINISLLFSVPDPHNPGKFIRREAHQVHLLPDRSSLKIRSKDGRLQVENLAGLALCGGSWSFDLRPVRLDDTVTVSLLDNCGKKWEMPVSPYRQTVEIYPEETTNGVL